MKFTIISAPKNISSKLSLSYIVELQLQQYMVSPMLSTFDFRNLILNQRSVKCTRKADRRKKCPVSRGSPKYSTISRYFTIVIPALHKMRGIQIEIDTFQETPHPLHNITQKFHILFYLGTKKMERVSRVLFWEFLGFIINSFCHTLGQHNLVLHTKVHRE